MNGSPDYKALLSTFLQNNPYSTVGATEGGHGVINPWGDESLVIVLGGAGDTVIETLNKAILPERYTGIYHPTQTALEFIYTAYTVSPDIQSRAFKFVYGGSEYACEFKRSSDSVLHLAAAYRPVGPTNTAFRNLASFRRWLDAGQPTSAGPLSFWVSPIEFDDDRVLGLVNHLNFFLSYYDVTSPRILIHTPASESVARQPQTRMLLDKFPSKIVAKSIDDVLIAFWSAAQSGDPARRFLYNYQIVEYCAHYYLEDEIKKRVRMELSAPHALDDVTSLTEEIIDAVSENTAHETAKVDGLLRATVNPARIWPTIEKNLGAFSQPTEFHGGQVVPAIAKLGWKLDDFQVNWAPSVSGALRKIRNALSHAKEQRGSAVITPTGANFQKLQAWLPLMSAVANEVMIYRSVN